MANTKYLFSWTVAAASLALTLFGSSVEAKCGCHVPTIKNERTGAKFNDLQVAIDDANSGDTLKIKGKIVGNFSIEKNLSLIGSGCAVLDGGNAGTVLTILTVDPLLGTVVVKLANLTIQNGLSSTFGGGGIAILNSEVYADDIEVINNTSISSNGGGGIVIAALVGAGVTYESGLVLTNSRVNQNTTTFSGGGIANLGGSLVIEDSIVLGNVAAQTGAGILSFAGTNTIIDSTIASNAATLQGGGLENIDGSTTILTNVKFKHNSAGQAAGIYSAGIATVRDSTLTITDCYFQGNNSLTIGGALYNDTSSIATVIHSKIKENSAQNAGGIFNNLGATLVLDRVKFEDNIPNNLVNLNP